MVLDGFANLVESWEDVGRTSLKEKGFCPLSQKVKFCRLFRLPVILFKILRGTSRTSRVAVKLSGF